MPNVFRGVCVATMACVVASGITLAPFHGFAAQNPDQKVERAILDGSLEVVRTASTQADRFETNHLIVYIDKGLMRTEEARAFSDTLEHYFVATSQYLQRQFDGASRKVAKPSYYLTDRAGISHAESVRVFLRAQRVILAPAIAIHESVHLLLMKNPEAPRNRADLTPEEDARVWATSGLWLAEGFAGYVTYELAPMLGIEPDRLFVKGDRTTVDAEAREWIRDPRGAHVMPFVGSHGVPSGLAADRTNVAAPFYVLGHSFVKHLLERAGRDAVIRLYEQHFNGMRTIEEDVRDVTGRDLVQWRQDWLRAIGVV